MVKYDFYFKSVDKYVKFNGSLKSFIINVDGRNVIILFYLKVDGVNFFVYCLGFC